ncbi:MAG: glycosyltransferase family 2 protein, partial [Chitinispirillaceae bacterium]|nr:glycosyltransferase family 2 protein [Chitinispirillaceae bacterium]
MQFGKISVLILNWNGEAVIRECIDSVMRSEYRPLEVVVVDNASTDGSVGMLRDYGDKIKLVIADKNLGYAGGNNLGFRHCAGDYVVTLNNDIIVDKGWLSGVADIFNAHPDVGIIACRQMRHDNHEIIDALFSFPTSHLLLGRMGHGKKFAGDRHASTSGYVIGANGASAIYRRQLLDAVGGFEDSFFAYQEENDL